MVLFLAGGFAFAQSKVHMPAGNGTTGHFNTVTPNRPNLIAFNTAWNTKKAQIIKDYRADKLDKQQAKERMMYLKQVRNKQLEFTRKNGGGDITPDQKSQLGKMLE
jgi:hypothetical protein